MLPVVSSTKATSTRGAAGLAATAGGAGPGSGRGFRSGIDIEHLLPPYTRPAGRAYSRAPASAYRQVTVRVSATDSPPDPFTIPEARCIDMAVRSGLALGARGTLRRFSYWVFSPTGVQRRHRGPGVLPGRPQRGQRGPPPRTGATGTCAFVVTGDRVDFTITTCGLSAPIVGAHIHLGARGGERSRARRLHQPEPRGDQHRRRPSTRRTGRSDGELVRRVRRQRRPDPRRHPRRHAHRGRVLQHPHLELPGRGDPRPDPSRQRRLSRGRWPAHRPERGRGRGVRRLGHGLGRRPPRPGDVGQRRVRLPRRGPGGHGPHGGRGRARGRGLGAHPGYFDLRGFGRRPMDVPPAEVETDVLYQVGALMAFARSHGARLVHVKPHGALYNQAAEDERLARAVARGTARAGPELDPGGPGLVARRCAARRRRRACASRPRPSPTAPTTTTGRLRPRRLPGAVITDPAAAARQAVAIARDGEVTVGLRGPRAPGRGDGVPARRQPQRGGQRPRGARGPAGRGDRAPAPGALTAIPRARPPVGDGRGHRRAGRLGRSRAQRAGARDRRGAVRATLPGIPRIGARPSVVAGRVRPRQDSALMKSGGGARKTRSGPALSRAAGTAARDTRRVRGRGRADLDASPRARTSEDEVDELHAAHDFVAYMLGFMPGFAYLGPLPERAGDARAGHAARCASPRGRWASRGG